MELRDLEYFKSVCDTASFTKAAQICHISQPTITKAVHRLEEEIGVKLFDRNRSKKQISLTPVGELFQKRVEKLLKYLEQSLYEVQNFYDTKVKLGLPPIIGATVFPSIYKELLRQFPKIIFDMQEDGTNDMKTILQNGEVDMGFIFQKKGTQSNEDFNSISLLQDELKVCVSNDHPLAHLEKISMADLKWERFILLTEGYLHNKILISECDKCGFYPNRSFTSKEIITVLSLVEAGVGVTLLTNLAVKDNLEIVAIPLEEPLYLDLLLCWSKNGTPSQECLTIIDFIANLYKKDVLPSYS